MIPKLKTASWISPKRSQRRVKLNCEDRSPVNFFYSKGVGIPKGANQIQDN